MKKDNSAVHHWMNKHYGKPKRCEICGLDDPNRIYDWANKDHKYSRNREDWQRLCRPCHRRHDSTPEIRKTIMRNLWWNKQTKSPGHVYKKGHTPWNKGKKIKTNTALEDWIKKHKGWNKGRRKEKPKLICKCCGRQFIQKDSHPQIFCSRNCVWNRNKKIHSAINEGIKLIK